MNYLVGLDLGQTSDFTALAVMEREAAVYRCRHLDRFPLGTPYTSADPRRPGVGQLVKALVERPPLPGCQLVADHTGVGRAVVDTLYTLRLPCTIRPVTITSGERWSMEPDGGFHVPKRELVGTLQLLLQSGRLLISSQLSLAPVLERELHAFKVRVTKAANETFGAWREGDHDDLVLAVALACWVGERCPPLTPDAITVGGGSRVPPGVYGRRAGGAPQAGARGKGSKFPRW